MIRSIKQIKRTWEHNLRVWKHILGALLVVTVGSAAASGEAAAQKALTGEIGFEARGFVQHPQYTGQDQHSASASINLEYYRALGHGSHRILVAPFARFDAQDATRTHVDFREAYWQWVGSRLEVKAGITKSFWGVVESNHLVDIINQTDGVEAPDGEDKLGQPSLQGTVFLTRGTLDLFVMPFFRERTFPGKSGRLRAPWILGDDAEIRQDRIDLAARIFQAVGPMDIGLSVFHGTSREPLIGLDMQTGQPGLDYPTITQVGLEAQAISGAWLFKNESIFRSGFLSDYFAASTGVEYTFSNISSLGWDIGVLGEYHYDGRDMLEIGGKKISSSSLENDIFIGSRVAVNDVQNTEFLGGIMVDTISREQAIFVEASRRVGNRFRVEAEARSFRNTDPEALFHFLRKDSYFQMSLKYFY